MYTILAYDLTDNRLNFDDIVACTISRVESFEIAVIPLSRSREIPSLSLSLSSVFRVHPRVFQPQRARSAPSRKRQSILVYVAATGIKHSGVQRELGSQETSRNSHRAVIDVVDDGRITQHHQAFATRSRGHVSRAVSTCPVCLDPGHCCWNDLQHAGPQVIPVYQEHSRIHTHTCAHTYVLDSIGAIM